MSDSNQFFNYEDDVSDGFEDEANDATGGAGLEHLQTSKVAEHLKKREKEIKKIGSKTGADAAAATIVLNSRYVLSSLPSSLPPQSLLRIIQIRQIFDGTQILSRCAEIAANAPGKMTRMTRISKW